MIKNHNLSKSKYTAFRQCPKILWMWTYNPEAEVIDPSLQARFESGNEVDILHKKDQGKKSKMHIR